jgi:D-sedoheptulose 7-phosphate isomerase
MNNIETIFSQNKKPEQFVRKYLDYLSTLLTKIDETQVATLIQLLLKARDTDNCVYFIGNGGSAATASHFANDLQVGPRAKKPFKVQSLTDNNAIITAIANDFGYDFIFVKQLEALLNDGDIVVAISASGNSPNLIKAIEFANQKKCTTVGITGFDGGKLKTICKHGLHIETPKGEYGPVEDIHMIFDHIVGNYLLQHCRQEM